MRHFFSLGLRCRIARSVIGLGWILVVLVAGARGQMVQVDTPLQSLGDSYYERFQTGFSYQKGNFFFAWNPQVVPPFGGYDPSADARFGFSGRGPGGGRFNFGLTMGQGSSRSNSLVSPSLVVPNGGGGNIINSSFQPFVTSIIPVLGDGGQPKSSIATEVLRALQSGETMESLLRKYGTGDDYDSSSDRRTALSLEPPSAPSTETPLPVASASSAERGDISVAEIRRQQKMQASAEAAGLDREYRDLMARGQAAEAAGKLTLARYSYRTATRKATESNVDRARQAFRRVNQKLQERKDRRKAGIKSTEQEVETKVADASESS